MNLLSDPCSISFVLCIKVTVVVFICEQGPGVIFSLKMIISQGRFKITLTI